MKKYIALSEHSQFDRWDGSTLRLDTINETLTDGTIWNHAINICRFGYSITDEITYLEVVDYD